MGHDESRKGHDYDDDCDLCRAGVPFDPHAIREWAKKNNWNRPFPRHGRAIASHLERHFGGQAFVIMEQFQHGAVPVDVHILPPTKHRRYHVLLTAGMSDLPMRPPPEIGVDLMWSEVAMCVPEWWRFDRASFEDHRWTWPVHLLRDIARFPHATDRCLHYHHIFDFDGPIDESIRSFEGALFDWPILLPKEFASLPVQPDKTVQILCVIPLHRKEHDAMRAGGCNALYPALRKAGVNELFRPDRPSVIP